MAELSLGTLYEFNKDAMNNIQPLTEKEKDDAIFKLTTDIRRDCKRNPYYMLLCHERRDYTVFKIDDSTQGGLARDIKDSLHNRGTVLAIDKQPDEAYEIWIKDVVTSENFLYYLFNYTYGMIISQ